MAPFWKYFSKITKKIGENWKFIKKWLNMSKISKICNFWAISTCNTSKESIFHIEFNFKQKKYDLFQEKLKKSNFFFFFSKSMLTSCLQMPVSQICAKKFKNWVCLCFGNVLKLKVTKGELVISNRVEMADQYLLGGAQGAPPTHWLGLNYYFFFFSFIFNIILPTSWAAFSDQSWSLAMFFIIDIKGHQMV